MLRRIGIAALGTAGVGLSAIAGHIHGLHMRPKDERANIVVPLEAVTWRRTIWVKNKPSRLVIGGPVTCEVLEKRHLSDSIIRLLTYTCNVHIPARADQLRILEWNKVTPVDTIFDVNAEPRVTYNGSQLTYCHVWFALFVLRNYRSGTFELFFLEICKNMNRDFTV